VNRRDLQAFEEFYAATLRREAKKRRVTNPAVAAQLIAWADAAKVRADAIKFGPLFGEKSDRETVRP